MPKITELACPPEIGRQYYVPCGFPNRIHGLVPAREWIPLLLPCHSDVHILKFPDAHYNIDWRFVSPTIINKIPQLESNQWAGIVFMEKLLDERGIQWRQRKCHRAMPSFPTHVKERGSHIYDEIRWLRPLEQHYQHTTIVQHRCPHQGIDLTTIPFNDEGYQVCPRHGLCWSTQGQMVPRLLRSP
jgi:Rieske [2Fe-2S] domain